MPRTAWGLLSRGWIFPCWCWGSLRWGLYKGGHHCPRTRNLHTRGRWNDDGNQQYPGSGIRTSNKNLLWFMFLIECMTEQDELISPSLDCLSHCQNGTRSNISWTPEGREDRKVEQANVFSSSSYSQAQGWDIGKTNYDLLKFPNTCQCTNTVHYSLS